MAKNAISNHFMFCNITEIVYVSTSVTNFDEDLHEF